MRHPARRGLTLIELLVVVAIIGILLGLVVAVGPALSDRQRASRGAGQVQAWLNISRQRAIRDKRPSGVRLLPVFNAPPEAQYVSELQFIETPPDFTGGQVEVPFDNTRKYERYRYIRIRGVELPTSGNTAVQAGDVIDLSAIFPLDGGRALRRIVNITPIVTRTDTSYQVLLDAEVGGPKDDIYTGPISTMPLTCTMTRKPTYIDYASAATPPNYEPQYPTTPPPYTENYRIYRQPRPLPGEPVLQLPKGIAIDISRDRNGAVPSWYRLYPATVNSLGNGPFDILFDTSGRVVSGLEYVNGGMSRFNPQSVEGKLTAPTASSSRICLWVRDTTLNVGSTDFRRTDPTMLPPGDNTIICVYTKTGLIAPHPVNPAGLVPNATATSNTWNPFAFTQDAKSSGN